METKNFSQVGQLREILDPLPVDRPIMCQVVGVDGSAWNVFAKFTDLIEGNNMSLLTMYHPNLHSVAVPRSDTFTSEFLERQSAILQDIINSTPTSEKRNVMCDINIYIMDAANRLKKIEDDTNKTKKY